MHKLLFWASGQTPLKDFSAAQPSWRPKSDKDTQLQFFFHIFSILLVLRQFVLSPNLGFVPLLGRIRDGLEVRNQFGEGNTCMGLQRKVSQYSKLETWRVAFLCEESAILERVELCASGSHPIRRSTHCTNQVQELWCHKFRSSRILIQRYKARTAAAVKIPEFHMEFGTGYMVW
ncbi:uncharacterized protein LOC133732807 isoform X2 [Rosa rugosa]|uniref:uncharacterized protein LOC133732807 isoform X2 n=1 Tax=Rosa rugosa TaxID=74645 RepID=UPI002B40970E|nr:uncharacterized protein LOC133732807 isoform X2 [Rosa rugosa]